MTIGFIGFGKMAEALWEGFKSTYSKAYAFDPSPARQIEAQALGIQVVTTIPDIMEQSTQIFLCIKPQSLPDIATQVVPLKSNQELISILAGIRITTLQDAFGTKGSIVRVMPNTPCMVGAGMSALTFSDRTSDAQKNRLLDMFRLTGDAIEVPESWMDAVTGISGSGPAFMYRLAESAIDAGARYGMPTETAIRLFANTLIGAGTMMLKRDKSPAELVKEVTSPNGTTMAGLTEFDHHQIDQRFSDVILKAINRSEELSQ